MGRTDPPELAAYRTLLLPIHLTLVLALGAPVQDTEVVDPVQGMRDWTARFDRSGDLWEGSLDELRGHVRAAVTRSFTEDEYRHPTAEALFEVASYGIGWLPKRTDYIGRKPNQRVRGVALEGIEWLLDEDSTGESTLAWIADDVFARVAGTTIAKRYLAFHVLRTLGGDGEKVQLAMLSVARNESDRMRPEVLELLPALSGEAIDLYLVNLLGKQHDRRRDPHPFNLMLERIRRKNEPLGLRASVVLETRLASMLKGTDWREASRAIELSRGLVLDRAVPLLLNGLYIVERRLRFGTGSKRIQHDIVGELRKLSGRSIGTNPKNWTTWWIAYRQGRVDVAPPPEDAVDAERSHAEFFGLRPVTDRVTFVIDFSGSMRSEWGTTGHSRYEEAVEQMMIFLQGAGEQTRFNVILFSDEQVRSSAMLVSATDDMLERARRSLLERVPDGATHLRPAIELALKLDKSGNVDPEELEADTIIVLCDGETSRGPGWVRPLLKKIQADARVVFHCVLVGLRGDGTLRSLAESTGGDYIQI
jgi:Mg-chelatase subunit ChlD